MWGNFLIMTIKHIFFDIADTLLHKPEVPIIIHRLLAEKGIAARGESIVRAHRSTRELMAAPPKTGREFYLRFNARFLEVLGVIPDQNLCEQIYLECRELPWTTFDDVSVLDKIGMPVGVISNWDATLNERLTKHFHVDFHPVIISSEHGISKPDVGIYLAAIKKSGCLPHEIIHVGDSISLDIVPALAAGIRPILLDRANIYEYYNGERISGLSQLLNIINDDKVMS